MIGRYCRTCFSPIVSRDEAAQERDQHLEEVLHAAGPVAVEPLRGEREEHRDQHRQEQGHDRRVRDPGLPAVREEELRHSRREPLDRRMAQQPDQQGVDRAQRIE